MEEIIIKSYDVSYAAAFRDLNIAWIQQYFTVEEHDREQLDHPDHIISPGGDILFALYNNEVVGTCALIKTGDGEFELAKMAVRPNMQGKQIGKKLGEAVIEKAIALGARKIWLESNRVLTPAINLYKKLGFVEIPVSNTPYARADIKMEKVIGDR